MVLRRSKAGVVSVGLDVSSRQIRLIGLGASRDGRTLLQHARVVEAAMAPGFDAVHQVWKKAAASAAGAHCGLGPSDVIVHQVEFPEMAPDELQAAARIEAEQLMPDIGEMVLDFQEIGRQAHPEQRRTMVKMLIVAAPRQAVDERWRLLNHAGVKVLSIVPDSIALANAVVRLHGPERGAMLVLDIDEASTNLVVLGHGANGSVPIVRHIREGAQALPAQATDGLPQGAPPPAASAGGERWLRELERSIAFAAEKLGSRAERVLVVGRASASFHTLGWIEACLQLPVEPWNPLRAIGLGPAAPGQDFIERHGVQCAVAMGLAFMREG